MVEVKLVIDTADDVDDDSDEIEDREDATRAVAIGVCGGESIAEYGRTGKNGLLIYDFSGLPETTLRA